MLNFAFLAFLLINLLKFGLADQNNPSKPDQPPFIPVAKPIVLPYERAKAIRGCTDCPSNRTSHGSKACVPAGCHPLGTRCSQIPEFGPRFVTASSHHCLRSPNGEHGTSLFCCEKGSREALNILTLRARPNEYPHHVYVGIKAMEEDTEKIHYLHCAGSIIDRWHIITAAHCSNGPPVKEGGKPLKTIMIVVIVGQNHVQVAERNNRYQVDLERSIDHPGFSYTPLRNDISLLRLKEPLNLNGFVRPIRLANSSFKEQGVVQIVGYGKTDLTRSLNVLLTDTATILDNDRCAQITNTPKPQTVMCIGGENEPVPNQGDSGGPAICMDENNEPVLCGITSNISEFVICEKGNKKRLNIREGEALPSGCGYPPAIFTRVSQYYHWILDAMHSGNNEEFPFSERGDYL